ncbi:MAG: glycoside hydrolase family 10 protein [Acholeplasmatales bacterium]
MIKLVKRIYLVLTLLVFGLITILNVKAAETKTITINGNNLEVVVDPVSFDANGIEYANITDKAVLYTPDWPFLKTNREANDIEYVVRKNSSEKYVIEVKNSNANDIPLDGFILSIPTTITVSFNVGDLVEINDITLKTYKHAILSDKGVRLAFDGVNVSSQYNAFTYYNRLYKNKTGTNTFNNNEMIVEHSRTSNSFKVTGVGKGGNNEIPKAGFVIAANSKPKTYMLDNGVLFNEGDVIELVELEYMKFEDVITKKFTTINGTRFQDYLVIYPAASNPNLSTNQNIYGYEVAVNADGIVVERGVLVPIPEGGFVVSGHGINHTFVEENIPVGSKVTYNAVDNTIKITVSLIDQTLYSCQINAVDTERLVTTARDEMYDVNNLERAETNLGRILEAVQAMEVLQTQINNTKNPSDVGDFLDYKEEIAPLFDEIYFDTLVSRRIESRGTWHRPNETTLAGIKATLDELKLMNFTDIYLETFWNGYTTYHSKHAPYHEIFAGANFGEYEDYFSAFISEAKKRNIHVHAWVENFFVGATWTHSSLWDEHPNWRIVNINGSNVITGKPGGEEEGFLFFDPANPETREFVKNIYKEIIEYDIAGLHLDYIRYPSGNENVLYSTGYTEYATNEFKEKYNVTGDIRTLVKTDQSLYLKWNQYRESKISSFVEEIHNEIRPLNSDIILSIAVGPDSTYARVNLMQDWKTWVESGWIDSVEPMAYINDVNTVASITQGAKDIMGTYAFIMPGIAPTYFGWPDIKNAQQTDAINKNGGHGSTIFATHNLRNKPDLHAIFYEGTYKNKAVSIQAPIKEVLNMFIEDVLYKFDNIYIKNGVSTTEKRNDLEIRLNKLAEKGYNNPIDFYELYKALDQLKLELTLYAEGVAINRFMENIEYLMEILDIRINRYLINNGHWDVTTVAERPSVYAFEYPSVEDDVGNKPSKNKTVLITLVSVGAVLTIGAGIFAGITVLRRKKR